MNVISRILIAASVALLVGGCLASTHANQYIGKSISEMMIEEGPPVNVFSMPDGRRAFQWRWGGGTYFIPGTSSSNVNVVGNTAYVTTNTTPGSIISSAGCVLTYIARKNASGHWIVEEAKWPQRLFC